MVPAREIMMVFPKTLPALLRKCLGEKFWIGRALLHRKILAIKEGIAAMCVYRRHRHRFCIVSCERNAGAAAVKCLNSVYCQRYNRIFVQHIFIDDASNDDTHELIQKWLNDHPDHNVNYIHREMRLGGTANTVSGFRLAPDDSIVIELNGDDWLVDRGVLGFINRIYTYPDVWMTYNTLRYDNSLPALWARPIPDEVVEQNAIRDLDEWITSAPHTFRKQLFNHLPEETFYDPETGEYWESADDHAIYLAMLELAGRHARHLYRVTYVYNFRESSHCFHGSDLSIGRARRIRLQPRCLPLDVL
jgi:glycosyltransferase involved in cell wall biosynthesis